MERRRPCGRSGCRSSSPPEKRTARGDESAMSNASPPPQQQPSRGWAGAENRVAGVVVDGRRRGEAFVSWGVACVVVSVSDRWPPEAIDSLGGCVVVDVLGNVLVNGA